MQIFSICKHFLSLSTKEKSICILNSLRNAYDKIYAKTYLNSPANDVDRNSDLIVIAGFFSTANGIGAIARSSYRLFQQNGFNVIAVDLSQYFKQADYKTSIKCSTFPKNDGGTLLLYANGEETLYCLRKLQVRSNKNWKIIGVWAWELSTIPATWEYSGKFLDQLWTYSQFTLEVLRAHFPSKDIACIKPHIHVDPRIDNFDHSLNIPKNTFTFLTMCDSRSSLDRKNPLATIQAFKTAFPANNRPILIVKTRNFLEDSDAYNALKKATFKCENIIWIDQTYSQTEYYSLLSRIDCFVSLHRAEGFGLPMAEAMGLGKPVIATNWSGNIDFMNHTTSLLVNFKLTNVRDKYGIYKNQDDLWAEPDISHASAYMRQITSDASLYQRLSGASKKMITDYFDGNQIIKNMDHWLSKLDA